MQALSITTTGNTVSITFDRNGFDRSAYRQIEAYLRPLLPSEAPLTAAELRRLPPSERDAILSEQTAIALHDFENVGDCPELNESGEL